MSKLANLRSALSTRMVVINVVVTLLATLSTVFAVCAGTMRAGDTTPLGPALAIAAAIGLVAAVAGVFALRGLVVDRLLLERETSLAHAHAENDRVNQSVIAVLEAVHQLSQRDLTAKAPVTEDIIGAISDSVNQLALETAQVLTHVNEAAGEVERASLEVKSQADQFTDTSSAGRQSLKGMVDVLSRASESMQRVALLAYNSNRVATQASKTTETALATVSSAVSGMASIRTTIADVERRIKRLGERSHEIGQIVNLINTVSERTHVLALNASMQAAIAGEAGRGFAVVAEEVQRLAESSREATDRIGKLIYNMQIETTDAIAAMAKTIDRVVHEAEAAEASGVQMVATRETTAKLVEMVARISSSAEEQMTIATQLRASIDEIGADNARSVTQLAAQNQATTTLIAQAQRLVRTVGVFKLPIIARS